MKPQRHLWQYLLVSVFIPIASTGNIYGQHTENSLFASSELEKKGAAVSLEQLLEEIEGKYSVTFLYEEKVVADKYINPGQLPLEQTSKGHGLAKILTALHIDYWQLDEETYVLTRKKRSLISSSVLQQEIVTGTVTDAQSGETLPGVNVMIKGTTTGTSTDTDGSYELNAPTLQDTLVFSFVGYQTQEVPINGRTEIDVSLQPQAIAGEELVVVGYGTQRREEITGSVSSIEGEDIERCQLQI